MPGEYTLDLPPDETCHWIKYTDMSLDSYNERNRDRDIEYDVVEGRCFFHINAGDYLFEVR